MQWFWIAMRGFKITLINVRISTSETWMSAICLVKYRNQRTPPLYFWDIHHDDHEIPIFRALKSIFIKKCLITKNVYKHFHRTSARNTWLKYRWKTHIWYFDSIYRVSEVTSCLEWRRHRYKKYTIGFIQEKDMLVNINHRQHTMAW